MRQVLNARGRSELRPPANWEVILEEVNQRRFCLPGEVGTEAEKARGQERAAPLAPEVRRAGQAYETMDHLAPYVQARANGGGERIFHPAEPRSPDSEVEK